MKEKIILSLWVVFGAGVLDGVIQEPYTLCHFDDMMAVGGDISYSQSSTPNKKPIDEEGLLKELNPQMKKIYEGLTPEGKALTLELLNKSGSVYPDKNKAVKEASEKMDEKQEQIR